MELTEKEQEMFDLMEKNHPMVHTDETRKSRIEMAKWYVACNELNEKPDNSRFLNRSYVVNGRYQGCM